MTDDRLPGGEDTQPEPEDEQQDPEGQRDEVQQDPPPGAAARGGFPTAGRDAEAEPDDGGDERPAREQ